jgi:uncharacterized protein YndB with AHSA1/START domain
VTADDVLSGQSPGLRVQRRLPGPPEHAFAAWTEPRLLARWMSPFGSAEAEVDLRVGGTFSIVMNGPGQEIRHTGTYLELEPPNRLVFSWVSPFTGPEPSRVSVYLVASGADETELTLVHDRLPAGQVESHQGGWGQILDHLATLLAAGRTAWT